MILVYSHHKQEYDDDSQTPPLNSLSRKTQRKERHNKENGIFGARWRSLF